MKNKLVKVILFIFLLGLFLFLGMKLDFSKENNSNQNNEIINQNNGDKVDIQNNGNNQNDYKELKLPIKIENEKIQLVSLFQSSIANPDCNDEIGNDVASLEFINISDQFISKVSISLDLASGKKLNFEATNIPAGKKVWAFDLNNTSIRTNEICTKVNSDAEFKSGDQLMSSEIGIDANNTSIGIKNLTDKEIANVEVEFHCVFDGVYLGGKTYTYSIEILQPKDKKILEVEECYLGAAEAVKITQKK